jgi:hypothetical protein
MRLTLAVCEGKFFVVVNSWVERDRLNYPTIHHLDRVGDAHPILCDRILFTWITNNVRWLKLLVHQLKIRLFNKQMINKIFLKLTTDRYELRSHSRKRAIA